MTTATMTSSAVRRSWLPGVWSVWLTGLARTRRAVLPLAVPGRPVLVTGASVLALRRDLDALADEAFAWLRQVNAVFSTYQAESDISRLGHGAWHSPMWTLTCAWYWSAVLICGGRPAATSTRTRPAPWTGRGT